MTVQSQQHSKEIGFICGPCGCSEDEVFYDEPSTCKECGMERYAAFKKGYEAERRSVTNAPIKTVAILLFEGVQIIDYTGPYEVFGQAGWNVFTVAEKDTLLRTAMGMQVKPHYSFENAPEADFLLLPGGGVTSQLSNEKVIKWISQKIPEMQHTLSVCNGAYFLGATGFLDNKKATTFAPLIPGLEDLAPKAQIVRDERFTDNGQILTSAGLSSGIDAAIYLVSKVQGLGNAQRLATHLEYDWNDDNGYVRASLADLHLAGFGGFISQFEREILRYEGDNNHWIVELSIKTALSDKEILKAVSYQAEKGQNWKRINEGKWSFQVNESTWSGSLEIINKTDDKKKLIFQVNKTQS